MIQGVGDQVGESAGADPERLGPDLTRLDRTEGTPLVTRAIDGLVNVDFGDQGPQPEWMVRVKEDTFKGGDSFFRSPELDELLDDMDANGVEKSILMAKVSATADDRAMRFVE